jgi:hypothetical protein
VNGIGIHAVGRGPGDYDGRPNDSNSSAVRDGAFALSKVWTVLQRLPIAVSFVGGLSTVG